MGKFLQILKVLPHDSGEVLSFHVFISSPEQKAHGELL